MKEKETVHINTCEGEKTDDTRQRNIHFCNGETTCAHTSRFMNCFSFQSNDYDIYHCPPQLTLLLLCVLSYIAARLAAIVV